MHWRRSSSGWSRASEFLRQQFRHLELGKAVLGVDDGGLAFSVVVHGATALSTIVVFRRDIVSLVRPVRVG